MRSAFGLVLALSVVFVDAYPDGSGTCSTVPTSISAMGDRVRASGAGSYEFSLSGPTGAGFAYTPGAPHGIELRSSIGANIDGMLAYVIVKGTDEGTGTRVGTMIIPNLFGELAGLALKTCSEGPTVTHSGPGPYGPFVWVAPPAGWVLSP